MKATALYDACDERAGQLAEKLLAAPTEAIFLAFGALAQFIACLPYEGRHTRVADMVSQASLATLRSGFLESVSTLRKDYTPLVSLIAGMAAQAPAFDDADLHAAGSLLESEHVQRRERNPLLELSVASDTAFILDEHRTFGPMVQDLSRTRADVRSSHPYTEQGDIEALLNYAKLSARGALHSVDLPERWASVLLCDAMRDDEICSAATLGALGVARYRMPGFLVEGVTRYLRQNVARSIEEDGLLPAPGAQNGDDGYLRSASDGIRLRGTLACAMLLQGKEST